MGFRNPIVGGTSLIRSAIKSPDYNPGSAGWTINKDGTAEFNDLTVRGTFQGTDYTVDEDGIFFYGGTPAHGNMTGSWAPMDGTDPYGNSYTAGLTLYSPVGQVFLGGLDGVIQSVGSSGSLINIEDGQYSFSNPGDWNIGLMIQNLDRTHGSYYIASGSQAFADMNTLFGIVTSYGAPVTGSQDTYPRTSTAAYSSTTVAHHYVSGAVVKSDAAGNTGEVWHTPSYNTNWGGSTTFNGSTNWGTFQYRKDAEDNVVFTGAFKAGATAPGSAIFQLPAGFRPLKQWPIWCQRNNGGTLTSGFLGVSSSGNVNMLTASGLAPVAGNEYLVSGSFPLGNIT